MTAPWQFGWEALAAIGTLAAAGTALYLAIRERADRLAAEKDRDDARYEQRRREIERFASLVVVGMHSEHAGMTPLPEPQLKSRHTLTITNNSGAAIVQVQARNGTQDLAAEPEDLFGSGDDAVKTPGKNYVAVLNHGDAFTLSFLRIDSDPVVTDPLAIGFSFTDAAGASWIKRFGGKLERVE